MDNQQFSSFEEQNQPYATPAGPKNAKYFRARAREALKGKLVATSLGAFLYNLVISGVMMVAILPLYAILIVSVLRYQSFPREMLPVMLLAFGVTFAIILLGVILLSGPMAVGYTRMHLIAIDGTEPKMGVLFWGFKTCFGKAISLCIKLFLLSCLAVLPTFAGFFLSVIFIALELAVPGVICMVAGYLLTMVLAMVIYYRYSLSYYVLAEYPEMSSGDALRNSAMLTKGKKWKLFCLDLSFIGWVFVIYFGGILTCGIGLIVGLYVLMAYMQTARAAFYDDAANRAAAREVEFPSIDPADYFSNHIDASQSDPS